MEKNLLAVESELQGGLKYDKIALDLFNKLIKLMHKYGSNYGEKAVIFNLSGEPNPNGITPNHLLYIYNRFGKESILSKLEKLFKLQNITPIIGNDDLWIIKWDEVKTANEIVVLITTRDLIQLGYNPANGSLFRDILDQLKLGLIKKEIKETKQHQLLWIKKNFPK